MHNKDLMLILKCCGHSEEEDEIKSIISQAKFYAFEPVIKSPCDAKSLLEEIQTEHQYKYLYLSAHGDENGFGNEAKTLNVPWAEFGRIICETDCLTEDAILLMSCCRGGLNEIAYDMFYACPNIQYVCGPRQNIQSSESIIGFNILLFNMIYRGLDPLLACQAIENGVSIRFKCFDRMETVTEAAYLMRIQNYEEIEEPNQVIYLDANRFMMSPDTPLSILELMKEGMIKMIEERKIIEEK